MIKVTYINKLDASKQESLFQNQGELTAHSEAHPELYETALFDVVIEDVTAQQAEDAQIAKYLARIQFGQKLMAQLAAKNKAALDAELLTIEQVVALKQALAPVKDFLTEGSLGFALGALQQVEGLDLALKEYFVGQIQAYLAGEEPAVEPVIEPTPEPQPEPTP